MLKNTVFWVFKELIYNLIFLSTKNTSFLTQFQIIYLYSTIILD
jgi:hypothetical protein